VIQCKGKLLAENAGLLKTQVKSLIPCQKRIVLDLTDLNRMDSAGLGVLVGLYFSARNGHSSLQLINLSKPLRDLLGITNLLSVFEDCGRYGTRMP
jgi:anti-sigma B factor antagonist